MKKKNAITKFIIIGFVLIIGILLTVCQFNIPFTTYTYNGFANSIKLGIDLQGGVLAVYNVEKDPTISGDFDTQVEATITRLQSLIFDKGYTEATVVREGSGLENTKIRVEVPDIDDPTEILSMIGTPANLEFKLEDSATADAFLTGKNIKSCVADYQNGSYGVSLEFDAEGTTIFHEKTSELSENQDPIHIYIDGEKYSSANVQSVIADGKTFISGSMSTLEDAEAYATKILSGTYSVKLSLDSNSNVSATLGKDALKYGVIAGLIGLIIIFIFMAWYYKGLGLIADFALAIYVVLLMFFLQALPIVQLTLPGIAGIILSLGMAVDANVIIFERMRDEYKLGKKISACCKAGFKKASSAILDSNITTIIASIVLYIFGSGTIKSFAITLLIGIVLSMFTSLIICRKFINWSLDIDKSNAKKYGFKREASVNEIN